MSAPGPTRRGLLAAGFAAALAGLAGGVRPPARAPRRAERRLLLLAWCRPVARDAFLASDACRALAAEGIVLVRLRVPDGTAEERLRALLTGVPPDAGMGAPPPAPTLLQDVLLDASLPITAAWGIHAGPAAGAALAPAALEGFDPRRGGRLLDLDPLFVAGPLLGGARAPGSGDVPPGTDALRDALARARDGTPPELPAAVRDSLADALVGIATRQAAAPGPAARDRAVVEAAAAVLVEVRPRLVVALLGAGGPDPDPAADEAALAAVSGLRARLAASGDLASETDLMLVSAFPCAPAEADRGQDRHDGGIGVAAGPGFARGEEVRIVIETIDVVPTACRLLGAKASRAKGRVFRTGLQR